MSKKRNVEVESRIRATIILIVIAFIAVGAYYSLQEDQTVYVPVKTSETPSTSSGTATQTPTPSPTVTAPTTPIPTTATPTATPPPAPTVTEATSPPTPVITSQTPVQTAAQPTPIQTQANKASYVSANFQSGDIKGNRITVPQGSSVDVYVVLTGYGSGILKTEVKKDLDWKTDVVLTTFQNQIFLNGEQTVKVGTFSANDLSGQNSFRQYFAKAYWNDNIIFDPTDPATRESVQTLQSQVFKPSISIVGFGGGGAPTSELTVSKGSPVKVYALVSSQGATSGTITIEVRKDKVWTEDISVTTLTKQVSVNAGQSWQEIGTFYPDESTGYWLREYFARGTTMAGVWEYNPTDPSSRPRVLVS